MQWNPYQLNGRDILLLPATTITTAVTGVSTGAVGAAAGTTVGNGVRYLAAYAVFVYGSGGTTAKAWVQTSFDDGVTWFDIINFAFATASLSKVAAVNIGLAATHATPTDAALADNTINNGLIGDRIRLKYTTTGTYAGGTTLKISLHLVG